jgi:hypothetical protein
MRPAADAFHFDPEMAPNVDCPGRGADVTSQVRAKATDRQPTMVKIGVRTSGAAGG